MITFSNSSENRIHELRKIRPVVTQNIKLMSLVFRLWRVPSFVRKGPPFAQLVWRRMRLSAQLWPLQSQTQQESRVPNSMQPGRDSVTFYCPFVFRACRWRNEFLRNTDTGNLSHVINSCDAKWNEIKKPQDTYCDSNTYISQTWRNFRIVNNINEKQTNSCSFG